MDVRFARVEFCRGLSKSLSSCSDTVRNTGPHGGSSETLLARWDCCALDSGSAAAGGQRNFMGKYCLHFHHAGQCSDCTFKGNAIYQPLGGIFACVGLSGALSLVMARDAGPENRKFNDLLRQR